MKIYAYMTKGEGKVICQDCVLVGNNILSEGYLEYVPTENETVVVAVADGVGGNMAGEVASFLAVYGLKDARLFQGATIEHTGKVIKNINQSILNLAGSQPDRMGNMATTLTGIIHSPATKTVFHIGNTRICKKNGIYLMPLTEAHEGLDGRLNGCLGIKPELLSRLEIFDATEEIPEEQDLVLTTDGIHDHMDDVQLDEIFGSGGSIKEMMLRIEETARANGSKDDISIVWIARNE